MAETICIKKDAIQDLVRVKDEFDSIIDSLELMSYPVFMESHKKAKEQIKKRDFDDWNVSLGIKNAATNRLRINDSRRSFSRAC